MRSVLDEEAASSVEFLEIVYKVIHNVERDREKEINVSKSPQRIFNTYFSHFEWFRSI
jgi:hypothetical protein